MNKIKEFFKEHIITNSTIQIISTYDKSKVVDEDGLDVVGLFNSSTRKVKIIMLIIGTSARLISNWFSPIVALIYLIFSFVLILIGSEFGDAELYYYVISGAKENLGITLSLLTTKVLCTTIFYHLIYIIWYTIIRGFCDISGIIYYIIHRKERNG